MTRTDRVGASKCELMGGNLTADRLLAMPDRCRHVDRKEAKIGTVASAARPYGRVLKTGTLLDSARVLRSWNTPIATTFRTERAKKS